MNVQNFRYIFGEAYRDLIADSPDWFDIGHVGKIMPDLYSESIAINAIWCLVGGIPGAEISLPVYSSKLLEAADLNFFFKNLAWSRYRISWSVNWCNFIHLYLLCSFTFFISSLCLFFFLVIPGWESRVRLKRRDLVDKASDRWDSR